MSRNNEIFENSSSDTLLDLLVAVQVAIIIIDRQSHEILFANECAASIARTEVDFMVGKRCQQFICLNEEGQCKFCDFNQTVNNEVSLLLRADGTTCDIIKSVKAINFLNRPCVLETHIDITKMKQAEYKSQQLLEKLSFSEKRLELAMSLASYGIWEICFDSNIILFDDQFYLMAGYKPGDFPSNLSEWSNRVHLDNLEEARNAIENITSGKIHNFDIQYQFLKENGSYMWVRSKGKIIESTEEGKPKRFIGIHKNIDEIKIEERNYKLQNRLQSLLLIPGSLELQIKKVVDTVFQAIDVSTVEIWIKSDNIQNQIYKKNSLELKYKTMNVDDSCKISLFSHSGLNLSDSKEAQHFFSSYIKLAYLSQDSIFEIKPENNKLVSHHDYLSKNRSVSLIYFVGLNDSNGQKQGLMVLYSARELSLKKKDFLNKIQQIISQVLINDYSGRKFKAAMNRTERANRLMEGREVRIRKIKEEVNSLSKEFRGETVYKNPGIDIQKGLVGDFNINELRLNALSLAEDAEISRKKALEVNSQLAIIKHGINNSSDAIAITSFNGSIIYINSSFHLLFDYYLEELNTLNNQNFYEDSEVYSNVIETLRSGNSWQGKIIIISKSGLSIPIFMRTSSFVNEENKNIGLIWNFTDITEQRKIELKNQKDLDEKKQLLYKARLLQQNFIQKNLPLLPNFNFHALYMPCEKLGGDFFRILKGIYVDKLVIILGDCTDHGIKASMDASLFSSLINPYLHLLFTQNRTDLFLEEVSKEYSRNAEDDQFPTMFALVVDNNNGEIYYSNANSSMPFIIRGDEIFKLPYAKGMHIGYFDEPVYERKSFSFTNHDKLFLYTDAVVELGDLGELRFGFDGLMGILKNCKGNVSHFFSTMIKGLKEENSGFPLNDDTTMIILEFKQKKEIFLEFHDLDQWKVLLQEIRKDLYDYDYNSHEVNSFTIALDELCINAFNHGNQGNDDKVIFIQGYISCMVLEFRITDEGYGFNLDSIPDPVENLKALMLNDDEKEYTHGRGLWVSNAYVDTLKHNEKGNSVLIKSEKKVRKVQTFYDHK